jgi:PncC family amidohydrolase
MDSQERTRFMTALQQQLIAGGWWLCTAESCTGGLIAHWMTDIPGSSACFAGGVAAYANQVKELMLGVQAETILQYGAVSAPVAAEMAQGLRDRLSGQFDPARLIAVSTTGIAGPGGGTPEKPVGLVYIGISTPHGTRVEEHCWPYDRTGNKEASSLQALKMVGEFIGETPQTSQKIV